MLTVSQGVDSVYDTDLFEPWMSGVGRLWSLDRRDERIVCDHLRSVDVVIGDGVRPSNTGRGYVLRRLIRRVLTTLWRDDPTRSLGDFPGVSDVVLEEERRFRFLVDKGRSVVSRRLGRGPLREDDFHYLHDTHGLPRELVVELVSGLGEPR